MNYLNSLESYQFERFLYGQIYLFLLSKLMQNHKT
jgi:hypothetical protein